MKSNYTMLDNLQLGITPTKAGMQEVIDKVNEWNAANGEATSYTIDNYADVQNALIDYIEMQGMAGYAAEEGASTFSGSMASMKAAWSNVLTALTTEGDVESAVTNLGTALSNFLFNNFLPMVGQIIQNIPTFIKTFFTTALPTILENGRELVSTIVQGIKENAPSAGEAFQNMLNNAITWLQEEFPTILENGVAAVQEWISGWGSGDGHMIETVGTTIGLILQTIGLFLGQILVAGGQILWSLIVGFVQNIPNMVANIGQLLLTIINTITGGNAQLTQGGKMILQFVLFGLISFIPQIIQKIRELVQNILQRFRETDWRSIGMNIIMGIINGIVSAAQSLFTSLRNLASNALASAKAALGIASPSKEFAKQVGNWIPSGIAVGISANTGAVTDAMDDLSEQTLGAGVSMRSSAYNYGNNMQAGNESDLLHSIYSLLSVYMPECANGLTIDGERMANTLDEKMAQNQLRRASAW